MSNPIDNGSRVGGSGLSGLRGATNKGPRAPERDDVAVGGASGDTAVASSRLQQVRDTIDNTPEVDMDKVEAIKQAIAEGRFPIDPKRIAEKFAELEGLL